MTENVRGTSRNVHIPESVYLAMQQLGHQLTHFDSATGRHRMDMRRAFPVCMALAGNDVERAALICQSFADALEDWGKLDQSENSEFMAQPFP